MRRTWVLSMYGLVAVAAVWLVTARMAVTSDMGMFLPDGASLSQRLLVAQLRKGVDGNVILAALSGGSADALASTNKQLAARLRATGLFAHVSNGQGGLPEAMQTLLFDARYLLSPAVVAGHFSQPALRQALTQRLQDLASAAAPMIKPYLANDPTGDFLKVLQGMTGGGQVRQQHGVFFSADDQRSLLLLRMQGTAVDMDQQAAALARLHVEFKALAPADMTIQLTGPAVFASQARHDIQADVRNLSILATVVVMGFLWLAFRSLAVVGLSVVPLVSGVLAGMAVCTLWFGHVHGITIAFGATLIGVAVDYPMHFFSQQVGPGGTAAERFRAIWPTLRLGVVTTVIGFAALVFSRYGGLLQLGVFSMTGLLAAAAVTRWVLPGLLSPGFVLPPVLGRLQAQLKHLAVGAPRLKAVVALITLVAALGLWWAGERVWEGDPAKLSPISERSKQLDRRLREDLGAPFASQVLMVVGADREQVLRRSETLMAALGPLVDEGVLGGYEAAARLLPSRFVQQARQAAIPPTETLRADLARAVGDMPFRPQLFEPFIADLAKAGRRPPLTLEDYAGSLLGDRLQTLLFEFEGRWVAPVQLYNVVDSGRVGQLAGDKDGVQTFFLDIKQETAALMAAYRDRALGVFAWGAQAIGVVLVLGLWSVRQALKVLAAPVAVVVVDAALLAWLGGGLTLFHLVALLLVVGLGIDYALFFYRLDGKPEEWASTFPAIWKSWLTTVLVFGSLMVSNTVVLQAIGLTVSLGVTLCFVFGAVLTRARRPLPY